MMACDGKEERVAVPVREERTSMIDKKAFYRLSYGMFVITTKDGERPVGCIVNTFGQVTSSPFQVSVAVNKENATCRALQSQGRYVAACLGESASMELIGTFGFRTSDDCDKFEGFPTAFDEAGIPYVDEGYVARFSVRIVNSVDVGTHIVFIGEVEESACIDGCDPMTYAYYHTVKGGKTPPKASSYVGEEVPSPSSEAAAGEEDASAPSECTYAWRCTICGHIEYVDELPDDFVCPICGMGKDMFERIEL